MLNMEKEFSKLESGLGSDEGSASAYVEFDGLLKGSPQLKVLQKFHAKLNVTAISECVFRR